MANIRDDIELFKRDTTFERNVYFYEEKTLVLVEHFLVNSKVVFGKK